MSAVLNKVDYILKHYSWVQKLYKMIMGSFFRILGIFIRTDEKLILFNAHGRKYNDSPRTIFEYMTSHKEYSSFKYVWALDHPEKFDIPGAKKIKMDTLSYFITAIKSKYWVSCVNIERGLNFKKKQTVYLNTWHGIPIKHIGNAASGRNDFDFSTVDIFCYSGGYEKEIYLEDFNVKKESLLLSGLPRNEELLIVNKNKVEELKKKLDLSLSKKVILYAPTWRDSIDNGKNYTLNPPINFKLWREVLGSEYILLLRTHSYTNNIIGVEFDDFVRNFSDYSDINDLLIVSDILISDYSATIFDFSLLERPIYSYAYDYKEYKESRGFYFDISKELPNGIIQHEDELLKKIKYINFQEESLKTKVFKRKYINASSDSTKICVEKLLESYNG